MPPARRHATLLVLLLAAAFAAAPARAQDIDPGTLDPLTPTPQVDPDAPPEPEPEPEPEPAPAPAPERPSAAPQRALADTGTDPRAIGLLGGVVLLGGVGLRMRTLPERF